MEPSLRWKGFFFVDDVMDFERSLCFSFENSELDTYSRRMKGPLGMNGCYTTHGCILLYQEASRFEEDDDLC